MTGGNDIARPTRHARRNWIAAGVLIAAAAASSLWLTISHRAATPGISHGVVIVASSAVLCAAAISTPLRRRRAAAPGHILAAALAAAVVGGLLGATSLSQSSPRAGVPLLRDVSFGNRSVPVLVIPQRPGWNLVQVDATEAAVGLSPYHMTPATFRSGAIGTWARVRLPAGHPTLLVLVGGSAATVQLNTGDVGFSDPALTGPDGPECASAVLGSLIAGRDVPIGRCPSEELSAADADALRGLAGFIAARGVRRVTLIGDSSPRSLRAAWLVRQACARDRIAVAAPGDNPGGPVVIVSGWRGADAALAEVAANQIRSQGTYLAPWLLDAPLLSYSAGQLLPLHFDPKDTAALSYVVALVKRFPGAVATESGYAAWLSATGPARTGGATYLYAASIVYAPAALGHNHGQQYTWLPTGTITKVSGLLNGPHMRHVHEPGL